MYPITYASNWFESTGPGYMAGWLQDLYDDRNLALHLREIRFLLPQDQLEESGVVDLFDDIRDYGDNSEAAKTMKVDWEDDLAGSVLRHYTPLEHLALKLQIRRDIFQTVDQIPLRSVMRIYLRLFSVCEKVERVTVPAVWKEAFEEMWEEEADVFPLVKKDLVGGEDGEVSWGVEVIRGRKMILPEGACRIRFAGLVWHEPEDRRYTIW
ncbi:hypothetical protein K505DRAFT_362726 [Melanomma pulvis-pyrius CBS 109.77]|uniref:Uncharacterized protein n=1 Tax=Melanomma pulvis-pyrius CBS 109.77 TaxID=1314802 RepID=A0A6A6X8A4_9PLEO|nr:hypothetical protein K505DRAFT_362726 [Melanomma pulvis-pyrius CBS 109.77]